MQTAELQTWLQERLPEPFASQPPEVRLYSDEVVIILPLTAGAGQAEQEVQHEAELQMIAQQREATRSLRMRLANELQPLIRRHVAWGMAIGNNEVLFTTRTVPVMTRLGRAERDVLDTLVAAGVAETRSSALAYTVRAFATQHMNWLAEVREAISQVEQIRSRLKITPRAGAPATAPIKGFSEEEEDSDDETES